MIITNNKNKREGKSMNSNNELGRRKLKLV